MMVGTTSSTISCLAQGAGSCTHLVINTQHSSNFPSKETEVHSSCLLAAILLGSKLEKRAQC